MTTVIWGWLAEANTSAGAPWVICVASAELPAKLNWTSRSGLSAISWSPSSAKTSVSEAAAKTVSVPLSPSPPVRVAVRRRAAPRSGGGGPTSRRSRPARERRPAPSAGARGRGGHGTSTLTWVALTVATARTPDLEPELVGGLPGHQGDQPERPGLDLHLRHHGVADDAGDDAGQPVARRRRARRAGLGRLVQLRGDAGEVGAVHDGRPAALAVRGQAVAVDPAADGVVADAEQRRGLGDPVGGGHGRTLDPQVRKINAEHCAAVCGQRLTLGGMHAR